MIKNKNKRNKLQLMKIKYFQILIYLIMLAFKISRNLNLKIQYFKIANFFLKQQEPLEIKEQENPQFQEQFNYDIMNDKLQMIGMGSKSNFFPTSELLFQVTNFSIKGQQQCE
eukprot:TRINITY_DN25118_c0_g1_i1.p3 TRINITY_DN25118_c0_g1~~TRINITY_DN25118_c0_g1_i1.p3  ORF type:complete len:113 (-),score=18.15 TRINITY_DN25118_c0_g1_i1:123-461(-)